MGAVWKEITFDEFEVLNAAGVDVIVTHVFPAKGKTLIPPWPKTMYLARVCDG
jgi:hypothetical protein